MLSEDIKREIEEEASHYQYKQAASIEALKVVQQHHGWVSDEHVKEVAALLDMSPESLDGVATFYSLIFRKPVGKNVILLCDSISCFIMGHDRVRDHLTKRLGIKPGETTADGKFTLIPMVCLGTCDRAPAMMIGDKLYQDLDEAKIDEILEEY